MAGTDQQAVTDLPGVGRRVDGDPAAEVLAVEQGLELRERRCTGLLSRQDEKACSERQDKQAFLHGVLDLSEDMMIASVEQASAPAGEMAGPSRMRCGAACSRPSLKQEWNDSNGMLDAIGSDARSFDAGLTTGYSRVSCAASCRPWFRACVARRSASASCLAAG